MKILSTTIQLFLLILLLVIPFSSASAAPVVTSPVAGSTLTQSTQNFTWSANGTPGITQWFISLSSIGPGGFDIYGGYQGTDTSVTIPSLPTDGRTLYFRLWYRTNEWRAVDITYTACNSCAPSSPIVEINDPVDGSTLLESSKTFHWQTNSNNLNVLEWHFMLGTSIGGTDLYNSSLGTATQVTVTGLPTNGSTIYARLWYRTVNGWAFNDFSYTSCNGACVDLPHPSIQKTSTVLSDGINPTNPKRIPGALIEYTINTSNSGNGVTDNNSIVISDSIPANTALYVNDISGPGTGPIRFVDGSPPSGLTYTFNNLASNTDNLQFSNNGGASYTYTPSPDGNGVDSSVTNIRVLPQGQLLAPNGNGTPSFQIKFRVKVK